MFCLGSLQTFAGSLDRVSQSMQIDAAPQASLVYAWFVGYTPHIVAGVWFGHDDHAKIMNHGFTGTVAVPAWARFMMKATTGRERFVRAGRNGGWKAERVR